MSEDAATPILVVMLIVVVMAATGLLGDKLDALLLEAKRSNTLMETIQMELATEAFCEENPESCEITQ